jgi:Putative DNA-binding domain
MSLALPELQRTFRDATYGGNSLAASAALREIVVEAGLLPDVRLAIYRNNTVSNLCNALKADYPVVEKLVGAEFFRHVAKTYIAGAPSSSGDINDYGESFPEFLAAFPAAAGLPYLGDVARLERAWKQSFYSADAEAMNVAALAGIAPERFGDLHFELHPALRLLSSAYPVKQIWDANQADAMSSREVDLSDGAEWVLLRRVEDRVGVNSLPQDEFCWLSALSEGRSLAEAVDVVFSATESFDLAPCLQRHICHGSFVGFTWEGN